MAEKTEHTVGRTADRAVKSAGNRTEQIKAYLRRLSEGEDIEVVRADFARGFGEVDASEIMEAEQQILLDGTPLDEVQRLCDVHSALFHGVTAAERTLQAEAVVEASLTSKDVHDDPTKVLGHPLHTLTKENEALSALLGSYRATGDANLLHAIREVAIHYAKKGDLLYPHLKVRYGISGPSEVMWTVDDEIRDELATLSTSSERDTTWRERMDAVLTRAEEMVYKEQNILFPICAQHFSQEEWYGIYRDSRDYAVCLGVEGDTWEEAEKALAQEEASAWAEGLAGESVTGVLAEGEVVMPGGRMSVAQLTALLNTIPLEITFIDESNVSRYFNEGPKVFKRPAMALGREVFACHPPKVEPLVRAILDDFRNGRRDSVPVWMEKNGRTMLVTYMAVRDRSGAYLGACELVQDMEAARQHFAG